MRAAPTRHVAAGAAVLRCIATAATADAAPASIPHCRSSCDLCCSQPCVKLCAEFVRKGKECPLFAVNDTACGYSLAAAVPTILNQVLASVTSPALLGDIMNRTCSRDSSQSNSSQSNSSSSKGSGHSSGSSSRDGSNLSSQQDISRVLLMLMLPGHWSYWGMQLLLQLLQRVFCYLGSYCNTGGRWNVWCAKQGSCQWLLGCMCAIKLYACICARVQQCEAGPEGHTCTDFFVEVGSRYCFS